VLHCMHACARRDLRSMKCSAAWFRNVLPACHAWTYVFLPSMLGIRGVRSRPHNPSSSWYATLLPVPTCSMDWQSAMLLKNALNAPSCPKDCCKNTCKNNRWAPKAMLTGAASRQQWQRRLPPGKLLPKRLLQQPQRQIRHGSAPSMKCISWDHHALLHCRCGVKRLGQHVTNHVCLCGC
jgi:hypothetical protein